MLRNSRFRLKLLVPRLIAVIRPMDITTVPCGSETRDALAEYRDENDYPSYDVALRELLGVEVATE